MNIASPKVKCSQLGCFGNRATGRCSALSNSSFPRRGGKGEGDKCPFFKTVAQAEKEARASNWR
jgi:hypothetical protein